MMRLAVRHGSTLHLSFQEELNNRHWVLILHVQDITKRDAVKCHTATDEIDRTEPSITRLHAVESIL